MSILYLHVGHGKTGSSYLQSALSLSQDTLSDQGIFYLLNEGGKRAAQGKITSGNGNLLKNFLKNGHREISKGNGDFLFSSEVLFHQILTAKGEDLLELIEKQCFEKVKILLFVRDPLDHVSSSYQQSIKRGGGVKSIDEFVDKYAQPKLVSDFISRVSNLSAIDLTIKNYTRKRKEIVNVFCHWLGLRESSLKLPVIDNVNRSMTHSELYLQREFNKSLGPCGNLISDPLCEELPGIKSERFVPSLDAQERMLDRLQRSMKEVEIFMDDKEDYYSRERDESVNDFGDNVVFDSRQIEVFASSLSKTIQNNSFDVYSKLDKNGKLNESVRKKFNKNPADVFRDIAIAFEEAGNVELAYQCMLQANKIRPNGKFILEKLAKYKKSLT